MTATLLTLHLLNLLAPAVVVALLMIWLAPHLPGWSGQRPRPAWVVRFVWGVLANGLVIAVSLFFLSPGKMLVYAALVLASALTQFVLLAGWRR